MQLQRSAAAIGLALGLCAGIAVCPGPALAKAKPGQLAEMYGAPFSVAVDPRMKVERLAPGDPAALAFASLMPMSTDSLEVVRINWPKSKQWCALAVGLPQNSPAPDAAPASPVIAVMLEDKAPKLVEVAGMEAAGGLSRLCAWPAGPGLNELIIVLSLVAQGEDAVITGLAVDQDGTVRPVQTGSAHTLYGWFDLTDLDSDGRFELITRRSLDGVEGGFFYRAVRAYDPELQSYLPAPDSFKDFFSGELAWLDWLIDTQAKIQADPAQYESREAAGPHYLAEYEGQVYAFDSVVPPASGAPELAESAVKAMDSIRKYREELAGWIAGGAAPSIWKLGR